MAYNISPSSVAPALAGDRASRVLSCDVTAPRALRLRKMNTCLEETRPLSGPKFSKLYSEKAPLSGRNVTQRPGPFPIHMGSECCSLTQEVHSELILILLNLRHFGPIRPLHAHSVKDQIQRKSSQFVVNHIYVFKVYQKASFYGRKITLN